MTPTHREIADQRRGNNHPSLATLNGTRQAPKILPGRFHPAVRHGAVLGYITVNLPEMGIRLRATLRLGSTAQILIALPPRATGLRISPELADEIRRAVRQAVEVSAGVRRRLKEIEHWRVREAAEAVEQLRQLPLFAGPNGSGRLLATARSTRSS
jgi:hypothetical protein